MTTVTEAGMAAARIDDDGEMLLHRSRRAGEAPAARAGRNGHGPARRRRRRRAMRAFIEEPPPRRKAAI